MEKDFSTNQKRILQVVQVLSSQKMDILLLIDMSLISKEIESVLNDKRTYSAKILGEDSNSDLALLKIEENKLPF